MHNTWKIGRKYRHPGFDTNPGCHLHDLTKIDLLHRWTVTSRTLVLSCDSHTEEHDDIVLKASDSPRVVGVVVWAQCDMLEWAV